MIKDPAALGHGVKSLFEKLKKTSVPD